jgi:hypothetical protein
MRSLRAAVILALPLALALSAPARAQGWGTVKGKVELKGNPPAKKEVAVDKDPQHCLSKGPIYLEDLVVNPKNKGIRWVVVWLAKDDGGKADHTADLPTHPNLKAVGKKQVVIDQPCCRFEPHIAVLRAGQDLVGRNTGAVPHNFRVTGNKENRAIGTNPILPVKGELVIKAEDLQPYHMPNLVGCDLHKWMSAFFFVLPHPYFAVTDEDGNFEIKNAPAGKHRLVMWHDKGWVLPGLKNGQEIEIKAGKTTDVGAVQYEPKD